MADWSDNYSPVKSQMQYSGREVHLQGLFRGFGIERMNGGVKQGPYFYFLGNPHTKGAYTSDTSDFYMRLLRSLADKWQLNGSPPIGNVNAPGGVKAHYRGTTLWDGS